jgi:sulfite dehydrogenase (cytochrome) subunit B
MRSILRMACTRVSCFTALATALSGAAAADEMQVALKAGAGLDKVEGNCGACHSLDYIRMNSPFLDAAGWDAEVTKMIKAFGAPINAADAKTISDYLRVHYGP